jgi:transcriptional regulator with XRE-family HTH domain
VISRFDPVIDTVTEKPERSQERERFYRAVGEKMRTARDSKGFTQEAIAASVGLSRTSLTNIEKGRQRLLLHTFIEIASALESSVADLLPDPSPVLDEISKRLPPNLPPVQRDFITRTMNPSAPHEPTKATENTTKGSPTASRKQNHRSSGGR